MNKSEKKNLANLLRLYRWELLNNIEDLENDGTENLLPSVLYGMREQVRSIGLLLDNMPYDDKAVEHGVQLTRSGRAKSDRLSTPAASRN